MNNRALCEPVRVLADGLPAGTTTLTATATTPAGTTLTSAGVPLQLKAPNSPR